MEVTALSGVLQIFNKVIDDIYEYGKDKLKKEVSKELIKRKIPNLIENELNLVRYVKTLWQVDRAVNIDDFYCSSHLIAPSRNRKKEKRCLIREFSDFRDSHNIVVRGIAGQGKSIFLRYLCVREFEAGQRIPVFIELRRIQSNESLFDHISRFFEILDLPIDRDLFKLIAKSGKFIFFLDAFDEIDTSINQKVLNELEYLVSLHSNCHFVVTTRPNSSIEMSPLFDVWTLDDLHGNEYKDFIKKLAENSESAKTIIKRIDAHKSPVRELLCTPLLVTLLLITYKSYQRIPEQLSDFYESIFYVLLQRHDGTKPGFTRPRSCLLNDSQYREIFDALCYETTKTGKSTFDSQELNKLVVKSMSIFNINEDPEKYLKDIVTVTCLILREAEEYRFIHRSVQEYYASTFIKNRPQNIVIRFYDACLDIDTWSSWNSKLSFLSEIDKYRYNKYFVLPLCRKWIGVESNDELLSGCPAMTIQRAKRIIGDIDLGWDAEMFPENPCTLVSISITELSQIIDTSVVLKLTRLDYKKLVEKIKKYEIILDPKFNDKDSISKGIFSLTLEKIIDEGLLVKELMSFAQLILDHLFNMWKYAYDYTNKQESFDIVSDFLTDN